MQNKIEKLRLKIKYTDYSQFVDSREVKAYKTKDVDIAKLFSKHFKLPEHVEYLEKTKVAIAVGVPGRIGKLFHETG